MSIMAFLKQFPNDDACWQRLEKARWPHGPVCPKCENVGPTMACGRKHYHQCEVAMPSSRLHLGRRSKARTCRYGRGLRRLSACCSSKGLSSVALGRHLGVCQNTAWFLGHRLRAMMEDNSGPLGGIVEADETYVEASEARNRGVTMTVISPKGATAATRSSSPSSGAGSPVRNEPARTRSGRSPRSCSWKAYCPPTSCRHTPPDRTKVPVQRG
jgi:hypothetical protein